MNVILNLMPVYQVLKMEDMMK